MYKATSLFLAAAVLLTACSGETDTVTTTSGDTVEIPVDDSVIFISNAHVIDGTGNIIDGGNVLIEDGLIRGVGSDVVAPLNARVVDAGGKTVMPGFIEGHRHLVTGDPDTWLAEKAAANMQEFLDAGFTTVLSAIDPPQVLELRRRINAGEMTGPRILAGAFIPVNVLPPGEPTTDPARTDVSRPPRRPTEPAGKIPDSVIIEAVQKAADAGYDYAKSVVTVTPGGPEVDTLTLIVNEAHKHGMKAIVHAVSVIDTLEVIKAKPDLLVHTPHIGQLTMEEAQTIADTGIPMTSTLGTFVPFYDEANQPIFRDAEPFPWDTLSSAGQGPVNARLLWNAGIVYGYGTDTQFLPRRTFKHELEALALTFSERDIIKILTTGTAQAVGLPDEIGTLEPGKAADVVMLDGDPLQDLYDLLNVDFVVKGGKVVVDRL